MTDQQNSESNQEHQSVPEGAVLPPHGGGRAESPK